MYKATIVIPNINGKGWLKDSIESVYAQTEQDFELIIVDNGSTDESLEQARSYCSRPNFTLIENGTNTGFSHAVNQGIARAKGEYVVMFNNDAFAEPGWLAELIRTAETDPKIFAVQSLMLRHFERELAEGKGKRQKPRKPLNKIHLPTRCRKPKSQLIIISPCVPTCCAGLP